MASALKRLYWKISWDCRQFAAGRGLPREVLPAYLFLVQRYWLKFGRLRWFLRPKTYNELLHRKMLRLRDPLLQLSTEKVNARDYVAAKAGRDCLIPLHYVGADVDAIPFADLPAQYVIKASHGSGASNPQR